MDAILATEKRFFQEHHAELAKQYPGKYLLIQGEHVYGGYETHDKAVRAGIAHLDKNPFLVRSVLNPEGEKLVAPALTIGVPLNARL